MLADPANDVLIFLAIPPVGFGGRQNVEFLRCASWNAQHFSKSKDEFADVLRSVDRRKDSMIGDGYEELRQRGKKRDLLSRARSKTREEVEGVADGRVRKKSRFEKDQAITKKLMKKKAMRQ